jgi:hypothetical protein
MVPPLPARTAGVELFVDRALAANRRFPVAVANLALAAVICERLDGMPLSIELAAARARSLALPEIADRLGRRFSLLTDRRSHRDTRHSSLQATLDWRFGLLTPRLQALFTRLSVFAGSFDLTAAHAVCADSVDDPEAGDDVHTLDELQWLVDKSLVRSEDHRGATRFGLLETMRQYSAERIDPARRDALRDRHAEHYAAVAERTWEAGRGREELEWCFRIAADKDNLRLAFETAVERQDAGLALRIAAPLYPYTRVRLDSEMWEWTETALAMPGALDHPLAVRALVHASIAGNMLSDPGRAEERARQAAEVEARLGLEPDPAVPAALSYAAGFAGKGALSEEAARRALALAEARGAAYRYEQAEALYMLGFYRRTQGQPADDQLIRRCLELSREVGSARCIANAYWTEGVTYADVDAQRAVSALEAGPRSPGPPTPGSWSGCCPATWRWSGPTSTRWRG